MSVDRIIQAESGGDAYAKNPRSSATGAGQFIDSTWLATISKYRPDLVEGKSKSEILALRTDPALSRAMTEAYSAENSGVLSGAGFEASPGNTYLAHFAGPQGAVKILGADPTTPASAIMGEAAVKANPFLANMTAGDLVAWANKKMGGGGPAPAAAPMPAQRMSPQPTAAHSPGLLAGVGVPSPSMSGGYLAPEPQFTSLAPPLPPPRRRIDLSKLHAMLPRSGGVFS
jgi:hypothetical protein